MALKEFWKLCSQKNGLEIYDDVITLFNGEEIPEDLLEEEFDLVDIFFNIEGAHLNARQYDKILDLIDLAKERQEPFFEKISHFSMSTELVYYCFQKKNNKLTACVDAYIENPLEEVDFLFRSTRFLIFYGHSDLVEKLNRNIYRTIQDSPNVWGGGLETARAILHIELQKCYERYLETNELDLNSFGKDMVQFDFKGEDNKILREILNKSLLYDYASNLEELKVSFKQNRDDFLHHLGFYFNKYMYGRKISFLISGEIWTFLMEYWMEHNGGQKKNPNRFFSMNSQTLERFLSNQGGMIMDYTINVFAGLWGSCYVYDFLLSIELIDKRTHRDFKIFYDRFTQLMTKNNKSVLWKYRFIHDWQKPNSIRQEVWETEEQLFDKSFSIKGEVSSEPLLNPAWLEEDDNEILETEEVEAIEVKEEIILPPPKPKIVLPRKFSRNEKVKVRYSDGTEKEMKFKRVEKDLMSGECELI